MSRDEPPPARLVAMFPRGVDGLFLPPVPGVELRALVARGSAEEAWIRELLAPGEVLPYTLRRDLGPYPATAELLEHSDVHAALRAGGCDALLLSASCSPAILAWARRHRVDLIMTRYEHQRRFEDKIAFDAFLRRHGIPRPAGGPVTLGQATALPVRGPAVVQVPESMGGEGTFFVRGPEDVDDLARRGALRRGERYLVRERIEGAPYGITIFVAPGWVALSAVRLQCYHPGSGGTDARDFAGVQWIAASALPAPLRGRIDATFLGLGELLYRRRFFGFANVDFMVDRQQRVFVLECNPRLSAATPQLLRSPELLSGVPAGAAFLRGALDPGPFPRAFERRPLPDTSFRGATLDVVHAPEAAGVLARDFASGRYGIGSSGIAYLGPDVRRAGPGELGLFSFGGAGQACRRGDTLATVISDGELYDEDGEMLATARRILEHFRYTDDRPG